MAVLALKKWPFAPSGAKSSKHRDHVALTLRGIIFDFDGTLCEPQKYMFKEMREALRISQGTDILAHLQSLPRQDQKDGYAKVKEIERRAMAKQTPQPGVQQVMHYLREKAIRRAICTRNFDEPVHHFLKQHLSTASFDPILTREFSPPKPQPDGILHIAAAWGGDTQFRANDIIMVGDSADDMVAGSRAGAVTVLLLNADNRDLLASDETDCAISSLEDLVALLENGLDE